MSLSAKQTDATRRLTTTKPLNQSNKFFNNSEHVQRVPLWAGISSRQPMSSGAKTSAGRQKKAWGRDKALLTHA